MLLDFSDIEEPPTSFLVKIRRKINKNKEELSAWANVASILQLFIECVLLILYLFRVIK